MEELSLDDLRAMVAGDMATHARIIAHGEHHWDKLWQPHPASGGAFGGPSGEMLLVIGADVRNFDRAIFPIR